jgi:hypothetical protein
VDGKTAVASMAFNYAIVPARPAGAVWTSPPDFMKYVQVQADRGKLPDGKQLISAENLVMRKNVLAAPDHYRSYDWNPHTCVEEKCKAHTRGLLRRITINGGLQHCIGKEVSRFEQGKIQNCFEYAPEANPL